MHGREPVGVEIALLDRSGVIVSVNQAWQDFCVANDGVPGRTGVGVSYLDACAAAPEDPCARDVLAAIQAALAGELSAPVTMQIPCDAPDEPRWFDVLVSSRVDIHGACIGATVTLSLTQPSRQPIAGRPGEPQQPPVRYPDLPRLEMEKLVAELSGRVQGVLNAQARLHGLLRANAAVAAQATPDRGDHRGDGVCPRTPQRPRGRGAT